MKKGYDITSAIMDAHFIRDISEDKYVAQRVVDFLERQEEIQFVGDLDWIVNRVISLTLEYLEPTYGTIKTGVEEKEILEQIKKELGEK